MKKYFYCILLSFSVFQGCTKTSTPSTDPCTGISPKFAADVLPIINATCATTSGCHGAGSVNSGGALINHSQVFSKQAQIKFQLETGSMPKAGTISVADKNKIICWINNGAINN